MDTKEKERLIIALKRIEKPLLEERIKKAMKAHLMVSLEEKEDFLPFSLGRLVARIKKTSSDLLSASLNSALKMRLMTAIARHDDLPVPSFYNRSFRAVMSVFLLVIFSVTTFFADHSGVPVAMAREAFLNDVEGDVFVVRDGHLIEGVEDLPLCVGDTVLTHDDSSVTVHFLDDSVGRLGANSNLEIQVLYSDPDNPLITKVEILLNEGRLWGRVVNLVDERAFFAVDAGSVTAKVMKKASFDLYTLDDRTKITVFDNSVDLIKREAGDDNPIKTVIAGYSAEVSGSGGESLVVSQISDSDPDVAASRKWVAVNMSEDEKYSQSIAADVAVDVMSAGEETDVPDPVFTDAEFNRAKSLFLDGYDDLLWAKAMLMNGNDVEGVKYLKSFRSGLLNVASIMPVLEAKDEVSAEMLRNMFRARINTQMKQMAMFVPGDFLYPVKEVLGEVSVLFAGEAIEKTLIAVSNSGERLVEMQELIRIGRISDARIVLGKYREGSDFNVLSLTEEERGANSEKLVELFRQKIYQIKLLTAAAESLTDESLSDLRAELKVLRDELIFKVLNSLTVMGDAVPSEMRAELKDIYMTYGSNSDETDSMMVAFDILTGVEGGLNFISPEMITEGEATPDAQLLNQFSDSVFTSGSLLNSGNALNAGSGNQAQD